MSKLNINIDKQAEDICESITEIVHISQKTTLQSVVDYLRMAEDEEISLKYIIYEIERAMNKILIK
jgi:hypothetical protein